MICEIGSPGAAPSQRTAWLVLLPPLLIIAVITAMALPLFTSADRIIPNADFLQYLSRHEGVRRSLLDFHAFPMWSHWFGGGYPTLGDPELHQAAALWVQRLQRSRIHLRAPGVDAVAREVVERVLLGRKIGNRPG